MKPKYWWDVVAGVLLFEIFFVDGTLPPTLFSKQWDHAFAPLNKLFFT